MKIISEFKDEYRWLSNFAPVQIKYCGHFYPSVEHAYVAAKTGDEEVQAIIRQIPTPWEAKRFGRTLHIRPLFELSKVVDMSYLIEAKFKQSPYRELLLNTKNAQIVEGNYWHDNFWGDCYCKKCSKVLGRNELGRLIMETRYKLFKKEL